MSTELIQAHSLDEAALTIEAAGMMIVAELTSAQAHDLADAVDAELDRVFSPEQMTRLVSAARDAKNAHPLFIAPAEEVIRSAAYLTELREGRYWTA